MLTLKECKSISISDLFMAHISMSIPYEDAQKIMEDRNTIEGFETVNQKLSELIQQADKQSPVFSENPELADTIINLGLVAFMTLEQDTILYKTPDGRYINLNGYANPFVEDSAIKLIKPWENYYPEGTFRFKEFPSSEKQLIELFNNNFDGATPDKAYAQGIYVDVDDLEPFQRFTKEYESL